MFRTDVTLETANAFVPNTLMETLDMRFTKITDSTLTVEMPVTPNVHQPMGILHGGASLALAETVGSAASNMIIDHSREYCVGLEINGNHVRSMRDGKIIATAHPVHIGRRTHIWNIEVVNEEGKLVCTSRLTMAVIQKS